ncbi:MAG: hypothetical protein FWD97_03685 [Defluviitaleaceae bacterium]|nr:hypothetical protein [Defluviitaleaceae bacterium]
MKKKVSVLVIAIMSLLLVACNGSDVEYIENVEYYGIADEVLGEYRPEPLTFITHKRIGEQTNLSLHRILSQVPSNENDPFPIFDTIIRIYDEEHRLIQEIAGLRQLTSPFNDIDSNLMQPSFIDLNFDGYLDMRLFSYLHSERYPVWGRHYHWLWDADLGQFVFNQQLTDRITSVRLWIDKEAETWSYGWMEGAGETQVIHHFAYLDGSFAEVRREEHQHRQLNESYDTREGVSILVNAPLLTGGENQGDPYVKHIRVYTWDFDFIQEIQIIPTNYNHDKPSSDRQGVNFATFDIQLMHLNDDNYFDLVVAGQKWLWCPQQNQFVYMPQ